MAGGLVVQTEILEDLHQSLLLPGGFRKPPGRQRFVEQLAARQPDNAVRRRRRKAGELGPGRFGKFLVAVFLRIRGDERQNDVRDDLPGPAGADQFALLRLRLAAQGEMMAPIIIADIGKELRRIAVALDRANHFLHEIRVFLQQGHGCAQPAVRLVRRAQPIELPGFGRQNSVLEIGP